MISLLSKYWKLILDILLVIALVVALFLWNPFDLFGKEVRLQPTANVASQIKEIGQLVTAEYYGEVIASIGEAKLNFLQEDFLNEEADSVFVALKADVFNAYMAHVITGTADISRQRKRERKKKQARKVALKEIIDSYGRNTKSGKTYSSAYINDTLDIVLLYVAEKVLGERTSVDLKKLENERKRRRFRKKQLENLFTEIENKHLQLSAARMDMYLEEPLGNPPSFSSFYYTLFQERQNHKSQLAMIGRGSVKAGFDFGSFNEANFHMDDGAGIIHLFGITPVILDFDINPWFIPQNAVPGYDVVQAGRKAGFDEAKEVKSYCREKLRRRALEAGIIAEAQRYGEDVLQTFLGLVLDREIKKVVFHENMEEAYLSTIQKDGVIHHHEIGLIKKAEEQYLSKIKATDSKTLKQAYHLQLAQFLYHLRKVPLQLIDSSQVPFNYFTFHLHHLMSDSTLTNPAINTKSYAAIKGTFRWGINSKHFAPDSFKLHSHWFYNGSHIDTPLYTVHYNDMLTYLCTGNEFNADELRYICILPTAQKDFLIKQDSATVLKVLTQNCPAQSRSTWQQRDIKNYSSYLWYRQKAYENKSWVYKLRDEVDPPASLQKVRQQISNSLPWK